MRKGEVEVEDEDPCSMPTSRLLYFKQPRFGRRKGMRFKILYTKKIKTPVTRPSELSLQLENRATLRLIEYFRDKRGSQKSDRRINSPESALHQLLLLLDSQRWTLSLYLLLFVFDQSEKLPCQMAELLPSRSFFGGCDRPAAASLVLFFPSFLSRRNHLLLARF